jgi:peptidoglycan/xylan/chitin deacetylase (PgdA/CDA1 family)
LSDPKLDWLQPYLRDFSKKTTPLSLLEADEVINCLKELDDATIIQHLKSSASSPHSLAHEPQKMPAILQSSDLMEMSRNNLVQYGAHTRHHFRLNRLNDKTALEEQIVGCRSDLKALTINCVPIFCYPNGDITESGEQLVADHYQAACTTKTGWNRTGGSDFDLHRFNLHDGNSSSRRTLLATIGRSLA